MKEQSAEIENLKQMNSDLTAANANLRTQINEKIDTCEDQAKQLSTAKKEIEKLVVENSEMRQEVKVSKAMILDSANSNTELRNQIRDKDVNLQTKIKQLSDEEENNRQLSADNSRFRQQIESLRVNLSEVELSNTSVRNQLKEQDIAFQAEIEQLSADNSDFQQEVEQLEVRSSDLEATIERLWNQLREKDVICQGNTNQLSELHRKISDLGNYSTTRPRCLSLARSV